MNDNKGKISIVINTFNAEKHLEKVLESVKEFDEIIICDMYSSDNTINIANKYNCKIVFYKKERFSEPARNFAIQSASYDWVLVVDADEIIPDKLRTHLYNQIKNEDCPYGIYIPRKNFFMGQFMHASYPDFILRFMRKDKTYWPPYVHTLPKIDGKTIYIDRKRKDLALIHLANDSLQTIITKNNVYSDLEIEKRKGKNYNVFDLIMAPAFRFFKSYILKQGFRDGKAGFIYATMNCIYKFQTIAKILENRNNKEIDNELRI